MDNRNFWFMFWGFAAAWLLIYGYVLILLRRSRQIGQRLEQCESSLNDGPGGIPE